MGFEALGKKLAQLGQDTKNSVQKLGESYQANSKLNDAKKGLNGALVQLGEAVVEKFGDNIPEGLEEAFGAVSKAKEAVAQMEEHLKKLKGVTVCPECGKESAVGEKFCSSCGAKLPEEEAEGGAADKLKEDAIAAGHEVGDIVNDAADKARELFGGVVDKAGAFVQGVSSKLGTKEGREEAADDLREKAEDLFEAAKEAADDLKDKAADAAGEAKETAKQTADEVKEAAEQTADEVKEAAKETVTEAKETAKQAVAEAEEAVKE